MILLDQEVWLAPNVLMEDDKFSKEEATIGKERAKQHNGRSWEIDEDGDKAFFTPLDANADIYNGEHESW